VKYQHTDALGSPVAVTNEAGAVIERNNYEPYGAIIGKPTRSGIGYTGHMMDGVTGLTYMQQRYYDQSLGRFLSVDPVTANSGSGVNFNRYWYANDNPYKFVDPDGRWGEVFDRATYDKGRSTGGLVAEKKSDNTKNDSTDTKVSEAVNNPAELPENEAYALSVVFGQEVSVIKGIKILENATLAKRYDAEATTGRNVIHLDSTIEKFLSAPKTVLEEYYHVIIQWNTGDLTVGKYLAESARAVLSGRG
jgi:RHS repeat-associated protein